MKNNKAITLIALVITIVILIILAAVAINLTVGENGILARAKQAALENKKAQIYEEINIEIIEEQMERQTSPSDTPFIVSIKNRLFGTEQASNESVNAYSRKSWVKNIIMCDNHFNNNEDNPMKNTVLIIETTEDYEIYVYVNNSTCTATIDTDSFGKVEQPCAIHFDLNGGNGSISDTSIRKNFTVSMPDTIPTRTNYTFGGWCLNQDGSTKIFSAGSASDPITEETTFYAIWTLSAVTLSFDSNGGSGTMNPVPIIINTPTAISEMVFTAEEGYEFDKWTTNQDGSGDSYNDLAEITISSDTTLYAQWKAKNVESIIISEMQKKLMIGSNFTLTASVEPSDVIDNYKSVSWSSSNNTIASVSNGVVTANAAGTCVITATAIDGSGVTSECTVTVCDTLSAYMGYVTNGLLVHYDGTENTANGHNSSSSSWKNLISSNFNGTLVGGTWNQDSLTFDGTDDYVRIGAINYSNITFEVVMEYTRTSTTPKDVLSNFEGGGYAISTWGNESKSNYLTNGFTVYLSNQGYKYVASTNNYIANKKYSLSGNYNGSTISFWENNSKYTNNISGTISYPGGSTIVIIGANPSGTGATDWYTPMKIYSVRIYNRALSDQEVQTNYAVDVERFNMQ